MIYLDRATDNTPVTTATLEVTLDGQALKVEPQAKTATYEATSPALRKPGGNEVLVTIVDGDVHDLLVGTLVIPATGGKVRHGERGSGISSRRSWSRRRLPLARLAAGRRRLGSHAVLVAAPVLACRPPSLGLALTSATPGRTRATITGPT